MPVYLTPDQVVLMLPGLTRGALAQLRFTGKGPNYRKPTPKTVLYVESEVGPGAHPAGGRRRDQ